MTNRFFNFESSRFTRLCFLGLAWLWPVAAAWAQSPDDDLRAVAQSRLPAQALLNQGADLVLGAGFAPFAGARADGAWSAFGVFAGGRHEYDAGGRTKADAFSLLTGLGQSFLVEDSILARFAYGFFLEGGGGRFETSLPLASGPALKSEGRASYGGGGLAIKAEFDSGLYLDGLFRTGQVKTSVDFVDQTFLGPAETDFSAGYFSAASCLGYAMELDGDTLLDLYARLLWSHQGGGETLVLGPDRLRTGPVDSTRNALGAKLERILAPGAVFSAGAAWEHEFNGRAMVSRNDHPLDRLASLEGDSLLGELGLELKAESGFSARIGLGGAWGARESLAGSLNVGYEF